MSSTAREVVAQAMADRLHWSVTALHNYGVPDAVLAALREHWTSDEIMDGRVPRVLGAKTWGHVIAAMFDDEDTS